MAKKPIRHAERIEIPYDKHRWQQLKVLRSEAVEVMEILENANLAAVAHGSIARGDVTVKSDVDIFIHNPPSSFFIETTLETADIQIDRRVVIQATPHYAIKGYVEIGEQQVVSFPLVKMRRVERDLYRFSGEITLVMLREDRRVAGVDKRLMLIEPTVRGHIESSIFGREAETAKFLGISVEAVLDRVNALLRRDKKGRTGVFVEKELATDETFEMALKKLVETNPEVRRRVEFYEK